MTTLNDKSDSYIQGQIDGCNGYDELENPHHIGTQEYDDWESGRKDGAGE